MNLRRSVPSFLAIGFVLFVAFANVWSAPQRAIADGERAALYALGFTANDICGGLSEGHDHCPLCRFEAQSDMSVQTTVVAGALIARTLDRATPFGPTARRPAQATTQPRAPPFMT